MWTNSNESDAVGDSGVAAAADFAETEGSIFCRCGAVSDDGAHMSQCHMCQRWSCTECSGLTPLEAEDDSFVLECYCCNPDAPYFRSSSFAAPPSNVPAASVTLAETQVAGRAASSMATTPPASSAPQEPPTGDDHAFDSRSPSLDLGELSQMEDGAATTAQDKDAPVMNATPPGDPAPQELPGNGELDNNILVSDSARDEIELLRKQISDLQNLV